jgi:hypothetical protein
MLTVSLLADQPGRLLMEAGRIDFFTLPVQQEGDFRSSPPGLLPFADVQSLSAELARGVSKGATGRYQWRRLP